MDVYCISMEKNPEKLEKIINNISENGFPQVKIFEAVNGKELGKTILDPSLKLTGNTLSAVENYGNIKSMVSVFALENLINNNERRYHADLGTWGAIGCYLSHVSIWEALLKDEKNDMYLIFEDDIVFKDNFIDKFEDRMANTPPGWDILFLDTLWNEKSEPYNDFFKIITGQFFGAHAYIINKKCVEKLLQRIFPIEIQIDAYMSFFAKQNNLNFYTTSGLCGQTIHKSSIQKICVLCHINSENINRLNKCIGIIVCIFLLFVIYIVYRSIKTINIKQ